MVKNTSNTEKPALKRKLIAVIQHNRNKGYAFKPVQTDETSFSSHE